MRDGALPGIVLVPPPLKPGDKVRFVSPASTPDRDGVLRRARHLETWGLKVDFGAHAFDRHIYLAGTDDERLADLNAAFNDSEVRAIFATRGGKGSYRIADRLDFAAARRDPKLLIGFSDITVLHMILWRRCRLLGVHGALIGDGADGVDAANSECLRAILMAPQDFVLHARSDVTTSVLTTTGAAEGRLIGGNLAMIATAAGWALPALDGAILLFEAVNMTVAQMDRYLTMLRKGGFLQGIVGIALGQLTDIEPHDDFTAVDLLCEYLVPLGVPVLGGLPLGHGERALSVPIGAMARLDAAARQLTVRRGLDRA